MIRNVRQEDTKCIAALYNHYILNTTITFEEKAVSADDINDRINKVNGFKLPWLVAEQAGQVIGYAYATQWNARSAYRFSVEASIYLSPDFVGNGCGTTLYQALFEQLSYLPIRAVIGVIALPNPASIALHEKFGLQQVGHLKAVGFKCNTWIDVGYWQIVIPNCR